MPNALIRRFADDLAGSSVSKTDFYKRESARQFDDLRFLFVQADTVRGAEPPQMMQAVFEPLL